MSDYCVETFKVSKQRRVGHDEFHWTVSFGKKLTKQASYNCLVRVFDKIINGSFAHIDKTRLCKIYVLVPSNRYITIPSLPKSSLYGDKFVRSCIAVLEPDIIPNCIWLVRCLWQPGTLWIDDEYYRYNMDKDVSYAEGGPNSICDKDLDQMDMLMKPSAITCCSIVQKCCF